MNKHLYNNYCDYWCMNTIRRWKDFIKNRTLDDLIIYIESAQSLKDTGDSMYKNITDEIKSRCIPGKYHLKVLLLFN